MLAVFVILSILVIVSFLIIGVELRYDGRITLFLRIGPFKLKILPSDEEGSRKPKKEGPAAKRPGKKLHKGESAVMSRELIPLGLRALGRFRRSLCVDELVIRYTAAAPDPCDAAMQYGRVSAAVNSALGFLGGFLKLRSLDIDITVDFDREKPDIFASLSMSLAVWEIVYIGLAFALGLLNIKYRNC